MSKELVFTSLLDLAQTDTSDVAVIKSRLQAEGVYLVMMTEGAKLSEQESQDPTKPRAGLRFTGIIDDYWPIANRNGEITEEMQERSETFKGKAFNMYSTLFLADVAEAIGQLKGNFVKAHLPCFGSPGGVEGAAEGWLDRLQGNRVLIRVRHSAGDDPRAYYDWLGMAAAKKLGISWDEVGREPVDKDGNPIDRIE